MKIAVSFLLVAACAFGQGNTGNILGTVTDPSSAIVPNVKVVVTNVKTGVQSEAATDGLGNYRIPFLQPGSYRVEAEVPGFKKFQRENVNLDMTRELRIDIALETGAVTETVNIVAATPLVETETGTLGTTVENQQVTSLPTLNRDPQDFRLLVPGIVQNREGYTFTQGGLIRKDPYYIDGAHSSNHVWVGNPVNPNPDVLHEFKVLTNSFSAEYGETSGAVMLSTTKSGANDFHGTLFEFLRNDQLNAGNFFSHQRSILRHNQFGGTVGGPIRKNKTFFFGDVQITRTRGAAAFTNLTVPIADFRNGDFSRILGAQVGTDVMGRPVFRNQIFDPLSIQTIGTTPVRTAFPGNRIPASQISAAARKVQELFPAAQIDTPFANYNSFGALLTDVYEYDIKFDHHFSDKDKLMVRYGRRQFHIVEPCAFPGPLAGGGPSPTQGLCSDNRRPSRQAVVNHVHVFSARATNSLHLSWFQYFPKRTTAGFGLVGTEDYGIFGMPTGKEKLGTPEFNFINFTRLGSYNNQLFFELQNSNGLVNVASVMVGRHNLRFGGEARQIRTDNFQQIPHNTRWDFSSVFTDQRGFAATGFDYASFLLGLPIDFIYRTLPGYFGPRAAVYAMFVQDDIRVNRRLSLNLGLRWDAPLYFHERKHRSGIFDLGRGEYRLLGHDGFRDTPWNNDWINFGPRFGFAYSPLAGSRLVLRGGYGLFSAGTMSSGAGGFLPMDPVFADASVGRYRSLDQVTWLTTLDRIPYEPADKTGRNAVQVSVFPDDNPMSYFHQWNLNVEQEIKGMLVEIGYSGSRGAHLPYGSYNANAIPVHLAPEARGRFIAPYVQYPRYPGGVNIESWIGSSSYHALQIKAERRFSSGLGFLASYTFGKLINTGQEGYRDPLNNRDLDRGPSPDDAPHRLSVAYNYQLPFGVGRRWVASGPLTHVVGGWELNGITTLQSGFALTPGLSVNSCVCGGASRPNVVADPHLSRSERTLTRYFNPGAFTVPANFTIGNAGRGLIYGPGLVNFDLGIAKRFYFPKLREGANLEFRAEFYNLTNTPYFNNPNVTIGAALAGRITSVGNRRDPAGAIYDARQGQMALKFHW